MARISNVVGQYNDENNAVSSGGVSSPYAPVLRTNNLGTSSSDAAYDAWDILLSRQEQGLSTPPNGAYWVQPNKREPAYQVYCRFGDGGSQWMKAISFNHDGGTTSTDFVQCNWEGWRSGGHPTALNSSNWTNANDADALTPVYGQYPMGKIMCTRNDNSQVCYIWSMNGIDQGNYVLDGARVFSSLMSVINNKIRRKVNVGTYGNNQLQTNLWFQSGVNTGYSGGTYSGFKMNSDSHGGTNGAYLTNVVGGGASNGWSMSQIGCGRDNTDSSHFGGGIGSCAGSNGSHSNTWGGHWWGHGSSYNSQRWSSNVGGGLNGHTIWISRK